MNNNKKAFQIQNLKKQSGNKNTEIVSLNTKSGINKILNNLSNKNIKAISSKEDNMIVDSFKQRLETMDKVSKDFQKEFLYYLGVRGNKMLSANRRPITIRRGNDNELFAVIPRRDVVSNTNTKATKSELGGIMLDWDKTISILNDYGAMTYMMEFLGNTYAGWSRRVMNNLHIYSASDDLFVEWLRKLIPNYTPLYNNSDVSGIITKYLSQEEINEVMENRSLDNANRDDLSVLLAKVYEKL